MQRGRAHGIRRCPLKYPGLLCRATYHTGPFIARHVTRRNTYYGGARVINWIVALHYSCFRRASKLFDSFRIQPVDRWTNTTPSKTAAWQTCRLHRRVSYRPRSLLSLRSFDSLPPPLSRSVSASRNDAIQRADREILESSIYVI